jgi:RNA polymerase sigma-70 factor (ECF subfamily)
MAEPVEQIAAQFLVERHSLLGFIHGLVRDPHATEDIFQEVWLRLAAETERGTVIADQGRWCRGVARNLVLHYWRDQRNAKVEANSPLLEFLDRMEQAFNEEITPSDALAERQHALNDCLMRLPENSRLLLALRYEKGCPLHEVAAHTRQSTNAVVKALYRLRRALAECVEKRLKLQESEL